MATTENARHPFRLDGETALITGGATGIGFGIVQAFVAMGADVVLVGRATNSQTGWINTAFQRLF